MKFLHDYEGRYSMATKIVKLRYDPEGDYLEVIFDPKNGS